MPETREELIAKIEDLAARAGRQVRFLDRDTVLVIDLAAYQGFLKRSLAGAYSLMTRPATPPPGPPAWPMERPAPAIAYEPPRPPWKFTPEEADRAWAELTPEEREAAHLLVSAYIAGWLGMPRPRAPQGGPKDGS